MSLARLKVTARLLLAVGVSVTTILNLVTLLATEAASKGPSPSSIDQRVAEWELSDAERRFDEIGWAGGLNEAERLARESKRPLFVFTYSGSATEANAIALRRC